VLAHVEQLRPILQANSDVIVAMQAGFIGIWGEWYYTDHFVADPRQPHVVTPQDWANRELVLAAILDALPAERMVQLRRPQYKERIVPESKGYVPVHPSQAYGGAPIARVGFHNDCLLGPYNDGGTFITPTIEYPYLEAETQYLPMGGETCAANPPRTECAEAVAELAKLHWSYLNIDYHPDVIGGWRSGGCLDEMKRRLGYRFTLTQGVFPDEVRSGEAFSVSLAVQNAGWAAPFNRRAVELLLRHKADGSVYDVGLPDKPQTWLADESAVYTLAHTICTPADMPPGEYELLLNLPDPELSLYARPEYAIRLANVQVWEQDTGFNDLLHSVTVRQAGADPVCSGPLMLGARDDLPPAYRPRAYLPLALQIPGRGCG
jgi:hypothetical protein